MNLKSLFSQFLIGSLIFCFSLSLEAQSTSLIYKVKGKKNFSVAINFSTEAGSSDLSPQDFFNQSNLYFTLTADINSGKGVFKEADIDKILSKISLLQNGKSITQSVLPRTILNSNSRINKIIIAFSKSDLTIYKEFTFSVNGLFSEKISIDEQYFETYESLKRLYDKAMVAFESNQHIDAYQDLFLLHNKATENPEIKSMSFYGMALNMIDKSVEEFVKNAELRLEESNKNFVNEGTEKALNEFKELHQGVQTYLMDFKDYFESDLTGVRSLGLRVEDLSSKTEKQLKDNIQLFKDKRMVILEQNDYTNYQFSTYVDLLARLIIDTDSLWIIDKLHPIDATKVDQFIKEYSDLYDNQKQEFKILVSLINDNIEQGFVVNNKVIENLEGNIEFQKQPYLEIFTALNELENDKDAYQEYLKIALSKCSDDNLLKGIELWQLSFLLTNDRIGNQTLSQINEGAKLIAKKRWKQAEDRFNMLKRQISGFAPIWYYSGELKYNMGEPYSAEIQFKRALSIHAEYIAPRKYILDIFETNNSYTQLLANAEEAITTFDTWLFRYYKAKALVYLKKYDLAVDEILNYCITKNKWDTNQYFLLGDAYLELNKFNKAKAAYTKTQEIDPFSANSKRFDDKMRLVYQKERNQNHQIIE